MCGIVGIIGKREVAPLLVEGLRRLEYRGYDSAGIATLIDGTIKRRRAEGKLARLETKLQERPLAGTVGIGHTRWATHGVPNETNAHPHATERVRHRPQRHHREFPGTQDRARGRRPQIRERRPTAKSSPISSPTISTSR